MTFRTLLCILPCENAQRLEAVATDALALTEFTVVVLDDGSRAPILELCQTEPLRSAVARGRLLVLRDDRRAGWGLALQDAIRFGAREGFTHLLTLDADGQSSVRESLTLLAVARATPMHLIIGKRMRQGVRAPDVSSFSRTLAKFWVGDQAESAVQDPRSGYRIYPLLFVRDDRFFCKQRDFAIEVLIRLLWRGVGISEVEIEVPFPSLEDRVRRSENFWYEARLAFLNAVLAMVLILKFNRAPMRTALAFALGIFIGASPLFGFHTLIAAAAAFFLGLNFTLIFLGTQISLFAVLLVPGEIAVGRQILRACHFELAPWTFTSRKLSDILSVAGEHLLEWSLGGVFVGLIGGIIGGLGFWLLTRRLARHRPNPG